MAIRLLFSRVHTNIKIVRACCYDQHLVFAGRTYKQTDLRCCPWHEPGKHIHVLMCYHENWLHVNTLPCILASCVIINIGLTKLAKVLQIGMRVYFTFELMQRCS